MKYTNPVLPGFYPDPSVCAVDGTYYMVCSSFQYFPGVPLFESKDLINWTQIGNVLTRDSQLPVYDAASSEGIFAPTIRYHKGRFYMVTTNVSHGGNFYVYTDDIYGEWSDPIFVEQGGIDPSLYFEGDTAYFMSNGTDENGRSGIFQCEIDIATGKKLTEGKCIWHGNGGRFLEGPHLYKFGDTYYLLASEGGTEYGHMLIYAKGKTPYGPFEGYPHNPFLTNRNLGGYRLQGCGHGDIVQDGDGNYWMLHLAFRQIHEWVMHHTLGREVYLVPVTFDADGWFTAGQDGTTRLEMETDRLPETLVQHPLPEYTFANTKPGMEWCYLRNPDMTKYTFTPDCFTLEAGKDTLDDAKGAPTYLALRQQEFSFSLSCDLTITGAEAGISVYMTEDQHYDLILRKTPEGCKMLRRLRIGDLITEDFIQDLAGDAVTFRIEATDMAYSFYAETEGKSYDFGAAQSKFLSTEIAGNFTGVMLALFAQNGDGSGTFRNFRLKYGETGCE